MSVALVTGASSGIGRAFAERLARDGYDLVVVARRRGRLEELASRLRSDPGVAVEIIAADLGDPASLARVERRAGEGPDIDLLVNNAGFGAYMPFARLAPERVEQLIRVHVVATTRLARAVVPGMLERGRGTIVNVASMLAFSATIPPDPMPHRVVYAATKAYLVAFSQALAAELGSSAIKVQALCPGTVATEFHVVQGAPGPLPGSMDPADVVAASLAGLELGEVVCAPTIEDAERLRAAAESGRTLFTGPRSERLASRYRG
ncbi:MAG TPA: SDR family oxidoreductase [Candidatus Limnocylindria bacterium]